MSEWTVPAKLIRIIDGDTIIVMADLGWRVKLETSVRFEGINAPELGTDAGEAAKTYLEELVPVDADLTIVSKKLLGGFEKYGRVLAKVNYKGIDLGGSVLGTGHAVVYHGN